MAVRKAKMVAWRFMMSLGGKANKGWQVNPLTQEVNLQREGGMGAPLITSVGSGRVVSGCGS